MLDHLARLPKALRWLLSLAAAATLVLVNQLAHLSSGDIRAENVVVQRAEVLYVPDNRIVRLLTLGYDQAAADLLWVRTLGYFARHFEADRKYTWLEHFIDQILAFDPRFRRVYSWAGSNVLYGRRFTNENVMLSNRFYERAMVQFPDDYEPVYRLGLNYYVELKSADPEQRTQWREQGLAYLEQAVGRPNAPASLKGLVAGVSRRLGKSQLALQYLLDMYMSTEDPDQKERLQARIRALQAETLGGDEYTHTAQRFRQDWKRLFPYAPPDFFSLMGEPDQIQQRDVDWRTLGQEEQQVSAAE